MRCRSSNRECFRPRARCASKDPHPDEEGDEEGQEPDVRTVKAVSGLGSCRSGMCIRDPASGEARKLELALLPRIVPPVIVTKVAGRI